VGCNWSYVHLWRDVDKCVNVTDNRRIGRRKTLLLALSLQVSCSIICALVNNVFIFLVFRFILGIQTTGEVQAAIIIGNLISRTQYLDSTSSKSGKKWPANKRLKIGFIGISSCRLKVKVCTMCNSSGTRNSISISEFRYSQPCGSSGCYNVINIDVVFLSSNTAAIVLMPFQLKQQQLMLLFYCSAAILREGRLKMQDWKMADQITGLENAAPNNVTSCWVRITLHYITNF